MQKHGDLHFRPSCINNSSCKNWPSYSQK